jgi:hypothetical protein
MPQLVVFDLTAPGSEIAARVLMPSIAWAATVCREPRLAIP